MSEASILCGTPRVVLFRGFLSPHERDHLLRLSQKNRQTSTVVDNESGDSVVSDYRTGFLAMIKAGEDDVVKDVERRIAQLTRTRVVQGEPMQVIGYRRGQQYKKHNDWFDPAYKSAERHFRAGGQRIKTALIYLKAPEKGGETEFTTLGIKVKPEPGACLVWDNVNPDGSIDHRVQHAGLPVKKGEKIVMTRWIRQRAWDGSENAYTENQLNEKLCAESINTVLQRFNCQLISKPVIVGGKILAESRVFTKP